MRTELRFMTGPLPILPAYQEAQSVVIEFEGREFGWVERQRFPHQGDHEPSPGPMVTCLVDPDDRVEYERAAEALQRFLSALSFYYGMRIESRRVMGGSGTHDLLHPYGAVEASDSFGYRVVAAPKAVHVEKDARLRVALGVYREAMSAGSPFYRFLAFWNVLDAVFDGDEAARDGFLRSKATGVHAVPNAAGTDVAHYLREDSRNAVAHIVRGRRRTTVDPDLPADRERLDTDAYRLRDLSRLAVLERWPDGLILESADGFRSRCV